MNTKERTNEFSELMNSLEKRGIIIRKERQFDATMERGRALNHIHKNKLYKGKYHSFNSCVEHEFDITSQQARNLMAASETYDILRRKFNVLPDNAKKLLQVYSFSKKNGQTVEEVWAGMMENGND